MEMFQLHGASPKFTYHHNMKNMKNMNSVKPVNLDLAQEGALRQDSEEGNLTPQHIMNIMNATGGGSFR